jgi:hypothetical protein
MRRLGLLSALLTCLLLSGRAWGQVQYIPPITGDDGSGGGGSGEAPTLQAIFDQSPTADITGVTPGKPWCFPNPRNITEKACWQWNPSTGFEHILPDGERAVRINDDSPYRVRNADGTVAFEILNGSIPRFVDSSATCNSAAAGAKRYKISSSGVADQEQTCTKLPDNNYYWVGPPNIIFATTGATVVCESTPVNDFFWTGTSTTTRGANQFSSRSGYYTDLRVRTSSTINANETATFTLEDAASSTALACSINAATSCESSAVVQVTLGALVNMRESCTDGTGAATKALVSLIFYPN